MTIAEYLKTLTPEQKRQYAKACGTTREYLAQLSGNFSQPSPQLARKLAEESGGQVTLTDLRPDIWLPDEVA